MGPGDRGLPSAAVSGHLRFLRQAWAANLPARTFGLEEEPQSNLHDAATMLAADTAEHGRIRVRN